MSNSNLTKRAYAASLRELMEEIPFEKITVAEICERQGLTRKSFYYHFKDKYDLATWIFDEDCISIVKKHTSTGDEFFEHLSYYFYENRDFYQKLLKIEGQNSFSDHLEEFLFPLVKSWPQSIFGNEQIHPLCIDFVSDGLVASFKRWLTENEELSAEEYISTLKSLIDNVAASLVSKVS